MQGLETSKARADEAKKLLDWGFSGLCGKAGLRRGRGRRRGTRFRRAKAGRCRSSPRAPSCLPVRTDGDDRLEARIVYDGPVAAPIAAGAPIGRLRIAREGAPALELPLKAKDSVAAGGMGKRAAGALYEMTIGLVRAPVEDAMTGRR